MGTANSIEVKDGVVATDPSDFEQAIELIRRDKLEGLWIRHDYLDKKPNPPIVDLWLLSQVTFLADFGISESLALNRITGFDTIYQLSNLKKLAMHTYKHLDLSHFPLVETLFLTEAAGLTNLAALTSLRYARLTKLRIGDYSVFSGMRQLSELWIIQAATNGITRLDSLTALAILQITHCPKLESIDALPKKLTKLTLKKCPKLRDLSFLAVHKSLEFLYVDVMPEVGFVPSLPRLEYVGFENVLDGNLQPLIDSPSLRRVAFYPAKRKHYSHSLTDLQKILSVRV